MLKIKLYTREGLYVATIQVPAMVPLPEGILWGDRSFFWHGKMEQYREGLLWACPPQNCERVAVV